MKFLYSGEINVSPSRQRQEFSEEALAELQASIAKHGLIHPITVSPGGKLISGERRLRVLNAMHSLELPIYFAGEQLKIDTIPCIIMGDDQLVADLEEIELDENLKREDLTWQERAKAIARLHQLRQSQNPIQTYVQTAAEVTVASSSPTTQDTVRNSILLAKHLDNPDISKAKSSKDAIKILERQVKAETMAVLGQAIGASFSARDHTLIAGNCLDHLPGMTGQFDIILTDAPYGMGADKFGDGAGLLANNEHHYADSKASFERLMVQFAPLSFACTKSEAHMYFFCDFDNFHYLRELFRSVGWYVFRTPLINYKPQSGRIPLPELGPKRQYEILLYAIKGNKKVNGVYSDVITSVLEEELSHGAQKPVSLYTNLLSRSAKPGDHVLDAFAGTGTIFPACHEKLCRATGIELNPEYLGLCRQRLEKL